MRARARARLFSGAASLHFSRSRLVQHWHISSVCAKKTSFNDNNGVCGWYVRCIADQLAFLLLLLAFFLSIFPGAGPLEPFLPFIGIEWGRAIPFILENASDASASQVVRLQDGMPFGLYARNIHMFVTFPTWTYQDHKHTARARAENV